MVVVYSLGKFQLGRPGCNSRNKTKRVEHKLESFATIVDCFNFTTRGGEWYQENLGSRKFLFPSQNLGRVLNESRNFIFLCFFASRILAFLAARSSLGVSDFCFLSNGFNQNHDKIVYLIKNVR